MFHEQELCQNASLEEDDLVKMELAYIHREMEKSQSQNSKPSLNLSPPTAKPGNSIGAELKQLLHDTNDNLVRVLLKSSELLRELKKLPR